MQGLVNKRILLGVSGGIAAYKSADLVRRLRDAGAEVRVAMTRAATEFVTPLTFQALSGHPVHVELLDRESEAAMDHIALARWADAILVAPASADFMARLVHGQAGELLLAVCLASDAPLALAPAMNRQMWAHAATRANVEVLAARGVRLFGPGEGGQACGEVGVGRMLEPEQLVALTASLFETGALAGRTVLVTAGPTREALDPVRFLTNRSSGKMGYAVAQAAAEAGARVILVSGPVALAPPPRVERVQVETAEQMLAAVLARVDECDVFVATAAVADYRPAAAAPGKLKKGEQRITLELERTPDILATVAARPAAPFTVGFAAETEALARYARDKLARKGLDMVAANLVGPGLGFDSDDNALHVFWDGGERALPTMPKARLARALIDLIAERMAARTTEVPG